MPSRNPKPSPTIDDVAKAVGVSRATVARAFSRPEILSAGTVRRVQIAATRLGYAPNPFARALSTGRQGNIAIVVPDIANPFFTPLFRIVQTSADAAGFSVFLGNSDEDVLREELLTNRLLMQVEGFMLASSRMPDTKIQELALRRPVVLVNRDAPGLPRVLIDETKGIEAAVAHLAQLHHRRLVYVNGPDTSWSDQLRRRAMRQASIRHKLKVEKIPASHSTFDAGKEVAVAILRLNVTAAVTFNDSVAHGLLAGLAELGIVVPRDFSIIGCDDALGASTYPALTNVSSRGIEAGKLATDLLISALRTGKSSDIRCVLDTNLIVRGSTALCSPKSIDHKRYAIGRIK